MGKSFFIFLVALTARFVVNCEIINSKVLRIIDIESQLVKIETVISLHNNGSKHVSNFLYIVDPDVYNYYISFKNQEKELLYHNVGIKCGEKETSCNKFDVILNKQLAPNTTSDVRVELVYIDKIVPLYKTRTYEQDHFVKYTGNLFYYSPYVTSALKTIYMWNNLNDIKVTHPPHHHTKNKLSYFHSAVAPFSFEKIEMEIMNNKPFLVVTQLDRKIHVSHFGKIYVEDQITLKNEGSKLVGPYEHKLSEMEKEASKWLYTHLPASAENIRFFDVIGNSSKSAVLYYKNQTTFKFCPRYPLLSGWKTFYIVSYSVPIYEYLYHDFKGKFLLKMRIVDHILDNAIVRNSSIKVLLPEGARIVQVDVPFGFVRLENEKLYTGLSTFGRPAIVFTGNNTLVNHIADFKVRYLFPLHYSFRVPLVLILYVESVFLFYILFSYVKPHFII